MPIESAPRVAILYPGDEEARRTATADNNRFSVLFHAFADRGIHAEPAVYRDDCWREVRDQLMAVDAVLVWVNPIEGGRDRTVLDAMLREVAAAGVFVSAHPDVIAKLGTKEVLHRTQDIGWGCDTHVYRTPGQLRSELPGRLALGKARVLKQYRGNGGDGVWKVQLPPAVAPSSLHEQPRPVPTPDAIVRVRHAKRGCTEEEIALEEFFRRCEPYFVDGGRIIDQAYQERLPEGMIRCYLVHDVVAGFGHQAINALYPSPPGASRDEATQPGPRFYHPPIEPAFQPLRKKLEGEWLPAVQALLAIDTTRLPVIWDCDFLLGQKGAEGEDTYVLCEINVSSVAPFPDTAIGPIVDVTVARLRESGQKRG